MNYSVIYVLLIILSLSILISTQTAPFPQSVITEMAKRQTRYHHYLWHNIRENWNRFDSSTKASFAEIGWEPPHPARNYDSDGSASSIPDNLSGEDFLYMHRQMIAQVNQIISQNGDPYGKIKGWTSFPAPGDADWPVPDQYSIPGNSAQSSTITSWKASGFYDRNFVPLERSLKDPVQLRKMTLSELGAKIEVTIHSYAHLRWSASSSYGYRNNYKSTILDIDREWDDPSYDWLVDSYSSHVNPLFWKIHGWVDDRIEDWRRANNLSSISWSGTWTGGPMSSFDSYMKEGSVMREGEDDEFVGDVMEKAFKIMQNSGVPESSVADLVNFDFGHGHENERPKKGRKMRVCKGR